MRTAKASVLRPGMKFRKLLLGTPTTQHWFTVERVDQARARGYLMVRVEGHPWVSLQAADTVEVQP